MSKSATARVAAYVIFRKNNKVAFVLRSNTGWMDGHWGLPSGKVDEGETYKQAAVREAKEEVGVDVLEEDLRYVHTAHRHAEDDWVDVYFEVLKWKGELVNNEPYIHSELGWFEVDKLPKKIASVETALKAIENNIQYSEYGWGSSK